MLNKDFLQGSCLRTDLNKRERIMGKSEREAQGQRWWDCLVKGAARAPAWLGRAEQVGEVQGN